MKTNRRKLSLPDIIDTGFLDPANFPIDAVLKQALSDRWQDFQWPISLLRSMYNHGRKEAGVFLIGLLMNCGHNWEKRRVIATALYDVQTEACVGVLFDELKRVKSTNSTRRYLSEVLGVLSSMPLPLVRSQFEELAEDKWPTPWMRTKMRGVLDDLAYRQRHRGP